MQELGTYLVFGIQDYMYRKYGRMFYSRKREREKKRNKTHTTAQGLKIRNLVSLPCHFIEQFESSMINLMVITESE